MEAFTAGTLAGTGSFHCESCGYAIALHERDVVPACPRCSSETFARSSMFAVDDTASWGAHEVEQPGWLRDGARVARHARRLPRLRRRRARARRPAPGGLDAGRPQPGGAHPLRRSDRVAAARPHPSRGPRDPRARRPQPERRVGERRARRLARARGLRRADARPLPAVPGRGSASSARVRRGHQRGCSASTSADGADDRRPVPEGRHRQDDHRAHAGGRLPARRPRRCCASTSTRRATCPTTSTCRRTPTRRSPTCWAEGGRRPRRSTTACFPRTSGWPRRSSCSAARWAAS